MLGGLIYSTNDILNKVNADKPTPFQIMDEDGNVIVTMTSLHDLHYEKILRVAYEPQENGQFAANSKQGAPFFLEITATAIPMLKNPGDTIENQSTLIEDTQIALDDLQDSDTIVQIVSPTSVYDNMTLRGVIYDQDNKILPLFAKLMFQEVRIANVQFSPLPADQVSNPENASTVNTGQVQVTTPSATAVSNVNNNLTAGGAL